MRRTLEQDMACSSNMRMMECLVAFRPVKKSCQNLFHSAMQPRFEPSLIEISIQNLFPRALQRSF